MKEFAAQQSVIRLRGVAASRVDAGQRSATRCRNPRPATGRRADGLTCCRAGCRSLHSSRTANRNSLPTAANRGASAQQRGEGQHQSHGAQAQRQCGPALLFALRLGELQASLLQRGDRGLQLLCERPHVFGVVGHGRLQFLDLLLLRIGRLFV